MSIYKEQRVGVLVDIQNLYYSAKVLHKKKVNFGQILKDAVGDRKLIRAIAYGIKTLEGQEEKFFEALEKAGYEVKTKDLQIFPEGAKKGDWDVGIAVDILKMAPKLDAVVLCSGDGDYELLLAHAKAEGVRAEVISFGRSTSGRLLEEVDDFCDLDLDPDKYLIKQRGQKQIPKRKDFSQ